jgi:hypothetical protein
LLLLSFQEAAVALFVSLHNPPPFLIGEKIRHKMGKNDNVGISLTSLILLDREGKYLSMGV